MNNLYEVFVTWNSYQHSNGYGDITLKIEASSKEEAESKVGRYGDRQQICRVKQI